MSALTDIDANLKQMMDRIGSSTSVRKYARMMGLPAFFQLKFPIQVFQTTESGGIAPTEQFAQSFYGIMQPAEVPDHVAIALPSGVAIVTDAANIEAIYVLAVGEPERRIVGV